MLYISIYCFFFMIFSIVLCLEMLFQPQYQTCTHSYFLLFPLFLSHIKSFIPQKVTLVYSIKQLDLFVIKFLMSLLQINLFMFLYPTIMLIFLFVFLRILMQILQIYYYLCFPVQEDQDFHLHDRLHINFKFCCWPFSLHKVVPTRKKMIADFLLVCKY